jgi:hypothetical protein
MTEENKEHFRTIFEGFRTSYRFNPDLFLTAEAPTA